MNPDLDNWDWDPDGKVTDDVNRSQAYRKDYACLNDMDADDSLDLMIETIGKMRRQARTKTTWTEHGRSIVLPSPSKTLNEVLHYVVTERMARLEHELGRMGRIM